MHSSGVLMSTQHNVVCFGETNKGGLNNNESSRTIPIKTSVNEWGKKTKERNVMRYVKRIISQMIPFADSN